MQQNWTAFDVYVNLRSAPKEGACMGQKYEKYDPKVDREIAEVARDTGSSPRESERAGRDAAKDMLKDGFLKRGRPSADKPGKA